MPSSIRALLTRAALCAALLLSAHPPARSQASEHEASRARPHMDHNPKHGGVFFMASNRQYHLEGVYLGSGAVKIYLYDEYTRPIPAAQIQGTVELRNEPGAKPVPLKLADDGTLVAELPPRPFPLVVDAFLRFPGKAGEPEPDPDVFTLEFDGVSAGPGTAAPRIPPGTESNGPD